MPHRSNYWSDCFVTLGARPDDAETYSDRIIGWRTTAPKDQDSEASAYRMARLGYQPRGAKFPHTNELSLVRDLPISLVERALPFVTVYNGRPQINILDAAPEVIAALPGMTRDRAECISAAAASFAGNCEDPAAEGRAAVCNDRGQQGLSDRRFVSPLPTARRQMPKWSFCCLKRANSRLPSCLGAMTSPT